MLPHLEGITIRLLAEALESLEGLFPLSRMRTLAHLFGVHTVRIAIVQVHRGILHQLIQLLSAVHGLLHHLRSLLLLEPSGRGIPPWLCRTIGILTVAIVFGLAVLYQLVLPVVSDVTLGALVGLLVDVPSVVVISVANCRESLVALATLVGFFAGVYTHVHEEVAAFVERLVAPHAPETRRVWVADIHHDV